MREHTRWLGSSLYACSCDLLPSFWRCSLMGISPAMALILYEEDVLKTSRIHITALLYIFLELSGNTSWEHNCRTKAEIHITQ